MSRWQTRFAVIFPWRQQQPIVSGQLAGKLVPVVYSSVMELMAPTQEQKLTHSSTEWEIVLVQAIHFRIIRFPPDVSTRWPKRFLAFCPRPTSSPAPVHST